MKNKKLILWHLKGLYIGGSELYCQLMCKYCKELDKNNEFIFAVIAAEREDMTRRDLFRNILGKKLAFYGSNPELIYIIKELKPFVFQRITAGVEEFPFTTETKKYCQHFLQVNVFGGEDKSVSFSKTIFVSDWMRNAVNKQNDITTCVIPNPVEEPYTDKNLRTELDIGEDIFVFGHIGRPDSATFENINLQAYAKIESDKTCFVLFGVDELAKPVIESLGIKNYRLISKTPDPIKISKFYNTISVAALARRDGEVKPQVVLDSQAHGKPVISHYSDQAFQGQIETIQNSGFVVLHNDVDTYANIMQAFVEGKIDAKKLGENGKRLWKKYCYAPDMAQKMVEVYKSLA